jgi:two-component sensor histidine kinase
MVALTRVMGGEPFPVGCALLVHHIETAHKAFLELSTLLPGKVAIWTSEHDADRMHTPPVSPPKRRGFGSTVIETMTERTVDGTVDLDYAPSGVTWRLTCPAANALAR